MSNIEENKENEQNKENIINNNKEEENKKENINNVINAFKYFDIKKNGKIDLKELKYVLSHFGNKLTENEINNIFKKLGIVSNQNNELDYEQLINS